MVQYIDSPNGGVFTMDSPNGEFSWIFHWENQQITFDKPKIRSRCLCGNRWLLSSSLLPAQGAARAADLRIPWKRAGSFLVHLRGFGRSRIWYIWCLNAWSSIIPQEDQKGILTLNYIVSIPNSSPISGVLNMGLDNYFYCFGNHVLLKKKLLFYQVSSQFAAFWSGKLPCQWYCNILVFKLFVLDGILRLGSISGLFRFVLAFILTWFRVDVVLVIGLFCSFEGLIWGWFRVSLGEVSDLCRIYSRFVLFWVGVGSGLI